MGSVQRMDATHINYITYSSTTSNKVDLAECVSQENLIRINTVHDTVGVRRLLGDRLCITDQVRAENGACDLRFLIQTTHHNSRHIRIINHVVSVVERSKEITSKRTYKVIYVRNQLELFFCKKIISGWADNHPVRLYAIITEYIGAQSFDHITEALTIFSHFSRSISEIGRSKGEIVSVSAGNCILHAVNCRPFNFVLQLGVDG